MEKFYKLESGKVFKIDDNGNFYTLDISGNWVIDYNIEYVYYDPSIKYEEIEATDISSIDISSIEWTYENIEGEDVKYNKKYDLYYIKDRNGNWIDYFPLKRFLNNREANKIR